MSNYSTPLPLSHAVQNRGRIQLILHQLQEHGAYLDTPDPAAWQRKIRVDLPLPRKQ